MCESFKKLISWNLCRMSRLANRLEIFHVIVDNDASVQLLEDNPLTNSKWSVLVKVDCGGARGKQLCRISPDRSGSQLIWCWLDLV